MRFTFVILLFCCLGADAQMIIKAHANYRPYAVAVAQNLLLDDYPNAAAAYSLRKLDKDYTGSAIRVRKDTIGQPEQDISFDANGNLDTVALKSFVGNNWAWVTIWYDQSGNSRNLVQTTAVNQPNIMNAGAIQRLGKDGAGIKPTIFFNDANPHFFNVTAFNTEQTYSLYYIQNRNALNKTAPFFGNGTVAGTIFSHFNDNNIYIQYVRSGQMYYRSVADNSFANNLLEGYVNTTPSASIYRNGVLLSGLTSEISFTGTAQWSGFSRYGGTIYGSGRQSELILYHSNQLSNRTGITNNINDYYNIYWNGDFAGLLDSFPSSAAAYSLRNLDKDYLGPLVRVRRSSDNEEQDIYGDYYGNLDTVGLKNFVGANSGFVTTWYDQSGNTGRNATQTTAANQPRIVNVGVLEYGYNNKVAIRFDGSNDNFSASSLSSFLSRLNSNSVISVTSVNSGADVPVIQSAISSSDRYIYGFASTSFSSSIFNGTSFVGKSISITRFIPHLNEAYYTPTNFDSYNNNVVATGGNLMGSGATATTIIGARTTLVNFYVGWMQEIILYPTNQLSNRTGISNNLNTYWTIY